VETTGDSEPRRDTGVARPTRRTLCAHLLLLVGLAVAVAPGLTAGQDFAPRSPRRVFSSFASIRVQVAATPVGAGTAKPVVWFHTVRAPDSSAPAAGSVGPAAAQPFSLTYFWQPLSPTAVDLVQSDAGWAAAAVSIALAPFLFLWWRRAGTSFGRIAGIACGAVASAAVCSLVLVPREGTAAVVGGVWWTVPLGGALMCAAFLVAPAPSPMRDD